MDHEKSLGIIKPDAVERSLIGSIIKIIEDNNIKINQMKMIQLTSAMAEEFYFIHKDKPFYEKLISYMTSAPVVLMVLEGKDVVKRYRDLMGKTNPEEAAEGTIRKLYAIDTTFNQVHGYDSIENALAEISLFF